MHCPNCGKEHEQNDLFCSGCGTKISSQIKETSTASEATTLKIDKRLIIIFCLAAGLFFGGALGYSLAPESKGRGEKPSVIDLIKGTYYDTVAYELVTTKDSNSHIADALRQGRGSLFTLSLLGALTGGIVGGMITKKKN
ncbi:zinc-ribbon domain-containing protein [Paenibacillus sp. NFR01]|uniref:zinc-ribbon domain-containing protein n=1 Tax=Paenibacillus sp. NFR01 TaxID=1566279 RepID=UPI0008CB2B76|nr:zinc-ribbon domain-containing protein [Paenibacillus sp. NFR01]SET61635.1 zinc-ribbon domain-containing protein [Paenibacillus sp. NFR01]